MACHSLTIPALACASALAFAAPAFAETPPALAEQFRAVCDSELVKSDKLAAACAAERLPKALKDGSRFVATGYGAEVNALAANLHLIRK